MPTKLDPHIIIERLQTEIRDACMELSAITNCATTSTNLMGLIGCARIKIEKLEKEIVSLKTALTNT